MSENKGQRSCADCGSVHCGKPKGEYPEFCLTTHLEQKELEEVLALYDEPENHAITLNAADIEFEFYKKYTRIQELVEFAKRMGYKDIGIATCMGLIDETRILAKILRSHGFEVYGVACKVSATPKSRVGIDERCEGVGVAMCNPILQAKLLNKHNTQLNVIMGLCVGHDCLFVKYSEAPVTTLVVKDRVLGHNPVAGLYTAGTYYGHLLKKD